MIIGNGRETEQLIEAGPANSHGADLEINNSHQNSHQTILASRFREANFQ
jgi:hypothetical protein